MQVVWAAYAEPRLVREAMLSAASYALRSNPPATASADPPATAVAGPPTAAAARAASDPPATAIPAADTLGLSPQKEVRFEGFAETDTLVARIVLSVPHMRFTFVGLAAVTPTEWDAAHKAIGKASAGDDGVSALLPHTAAVVPGACDAAMIAAVSSHGLYKPLLQQSFAATKLQNIRPSTQVQLLI